MFLEVVERIRPVPPIPLLTLGTLDGYYGIAIVCNTTLAFVFSIRKYNILGERCFLFSIVAVPIFWAARVAPEYARMLKTENWMEDYWQYWLIFYLALCTVIVQDTGIEKRFLTIAKSAQSLVVTKICLAVAILIPIR